MEQYSNEPTGALTEQTIFDDKSLLELAKRRIATKKNVVGQVLDFCAIMIYGFFMVLLYGEGERAGLTFIFLMFWGIRLLMRVVKFAKPSFKDGIAAYFRGQKERKLETEINRLRKMTPEFVAMELNK